MSSRRKNKKWACWVITGSETVVAQQGSDVMTRHEFETRLERDAFVAGVNLVVGWSKVHVFYQGPPAYAYVKKCGGIMHNEPSQSTGDHARVIEE